MIVIGIGCDSNIVDIPVVNIFVSQQNLRHIVVGMATSENFSASIHAENITVSRSSARFFSQV